MSIERPVVAGRKRGELCEGHVYLRLLFVLWQALTHIRNDAHNLSRFIGVQADHLDLLSDRIFHRPVLFGNRGIDNDDGKRGSRILYVEFTTANKGHIERLEIAGEPPRVFRRQF